MKIKMSETLKENLNKVYNNISESAKSVNRDPSTIKLVAVGKNHPPKKIIEAMKNGHTRFGENRVQELLDKHELFYDQDIKWHFIGHLQKNKVKYLMKIDQLEMIESIDSLEIAEEVNKEAKKLNKTINILLQVNIANDPNKFGFSKNEIKKVLDEVEKKNNLVVKGLMTITPYEAEMNETKNYYQDMKSLVEDLNNQGYDLSEISMGMSRDYKMAIKQGATIVRVGTAIFGKRKYY
ncbi:MAG: YggS family pyridoxal phosphate-dependent enzyme [Halanaerobiales bacterium]|nr:YggS family pyridoxal phosphate-dependent enzyme [Halanaerobiales bacterium]